MRDRKLQRALMQLFKPEYWFTVREALMQADGIENRLTAVHEKKHS